MQAYGFAAVDPGTWRVAPGHTGTSANGVTSPAPVVELQVEGHKEVDGHTWYSLACSLVDGSVNTNWSAQRRLQQLREDLHDVVKAELGDVYSQHFGSTPFAHKGGMPGTTARLSRWLCTLATCINAGHAPPSVVALVLTFMDAPEWKLDTSPVQQQSGKAATGLAELAASAPAAATQSRRRGGEPPASPSGPKSDNAGLEDIELSLTLDLDDLVLGGDLSGDFFQAEQRPEELAAEVVRHSTAPESCGPEAFFVQLTKHEDDKLGCDIVSLRYRNQGALRVEKVAERPGLVAEWNFRNPSMQVKHGHYIVEVNGESADTEKMYDLIAEARKLELRVQRRWP